MCENKHSSPSTGPFSSSPMNICSFIYYIHIYCVNHFLVSIRMNSECSDDASLSRKLTCCSCFSHFPQQSRVIFQQEGERSFHSFYQVNITFCAPVSFAYELLFCLQKVSWCVGSVVRPGMCLFFYFYCKVSALSRTSLHMYKQMEGLGCSSWCHQLQRIKDKKKNLHEL